MALPETVPYIGWRWDDLIFLMLAGTMLGAALMVVLGRDIIRSGLWLVLSFAGLAGIYALLGAPLIAAAQVLIYIGAISVLILFAIMLTQSKAGPSRLVFQRQWWVAAIAAVVLTILLLGSILLTAWPLAGPDVHTQGARKIAHLIFDRYVLAFEVISVLLLAAVIGAIFLARRYDERPGPAGVAATADGGGATADGGGARADGGGDDG